MIAYINDSFIEEEKAFLQVSDLALLRGYAAFDFLRTKNGVPLFVDDYVNRFFASAELMHLKTDHTKNSLREIIFALVQKNKLPQSGLRMILTGGYSHDGYTPAAPNLVMLEQPLELPTTEKFKTGLKVITHEYERELPNVKSTNYLMGIWLLQRMKIENAADVLYHRNESVSEFPRSNIFIVKHEGKIITPADGILKGITRMKLLELISGKIEFEERTITLDEVKGASEVFMTSTTKRILPVFQVDDVVIGAGKAGPIASLLNAQFLEMENSIMTTNQVS